MEPPCTPCTFVLLRSGMYCGMHPGVVYGHHSTSTCDGTTLHSLHVCLLRSGMYCGMHPGVVYGHDSTSTCGGVRTQLLDAYHSTYLILTNKRAGSAGWFHRRWKYCGVRTQLQDAYHSTYLILTNKRAGSAGWFHRRWKYCGVRTQLQDAYHSTYLILTNKRAGSAGWFHRRWKYYGTTLHSLHVCLLRSGMYCGMHPGVVYGHHSTSTCGGVRTQLQDAYHSTYLILTNGRGMVKIPEAAPIGLVKISEVRSSQQWAGDLDLIHDNDKFLLVYNHDDCWIYVFFGTNSHPWQTPPRSSRSRLLYPTTHPVFVAGACRWDPENIHGEHRKQTDVMCIRFYKRIRTYKA